MDAIAFFYSDEAELPRSRVTDDFEGFLRNLLRLYVDRMDVLQTADYVTQTIAARRPEIVRLCTRIRAAVRNYQRGYPDLAFSNIKSAIQGVRPYFDRLCTPQNVAGTPALSQLYRIRTAGPIGANFQRPDLYHVPFDKRHLVTRQRYSLPGLPCLYLGGTLYLCWEEVGRPSFDSIYYARFRPQAGTTITYLDFGYRPALIGAMIAANQAQNQVQTPMADFAVAQAVCWPLLAACSIQKKYEEAPFIAEYIVPQLILQWITRSSDHDGIRYFSVRLNTYIDNPAIPCNYVFPARTFAPAGHCATLRAKFEMSPALSWQIIERMAMPIGIAAGMPVHGISQVELVQGNPINYVNTPFGQIEAKSIGYACATF